MLLKNQAFFLATSALVAATAARADVTISSDATQGMSCSGGVCQPTASEAVLNAGDLETLLAAGNVTVTTTASGVQADNIDVTAKLGWSAKALTLDAHRSISVTELVTVRGRGGLSVLTKDGGSDGELAFSGNGHVTFRNLTDSLSINGVSYRLENSIASLAKAITKNPSGDYALAANYDASKDWTYGNSPITTDFTGSFEGLGNRISNLSLYVTTVARQRYLGLFTTVGGRISDLGVVGASVSVGSVKRRRAQAYLGILAGTIRGTVSRCYSSGTVSGPKDTFAAGLVSVNTGTVTESHSSATVQAGIGAPAFTVAGGLVGTNAGQISLSYAIGSVASGGYSGGLAGDGDTGTIVNSYATGAVSSGSSGGLVGLNTADVGTSYSTGGVSGNGDIGGLIGEDGSQTGSLNDTYWDMDTSGITNPDQGAGYPVNDPGITGLTTGQLQSGLPAGFDPSVWGENANINNGLPYLLSNPPE
ncbi:MAG TPA: hypothetical protein VHY79_19920 [Rhizomicrobium sp.]|nr:hypothetical protein [Rhizomicrobium sp.]